MLSLSLLYFRQNFHRVQIFKKKNVFFFIPFLFGGDAALIRCGIIRRHPPAYRRQQQKSFRRVRRSGHASLFFI